MGRSPVHRSSTSLRIAIGLVAISAIAGCGSDDSASDATFDAPAAEEAESTQDEFGDDDSLTIVDEQSRTGGVNTTGLQLDLSERDIITSVGLTMATSNVRETAADVRRLAESNGGAVFGSDVSIGDEDSEGSVPGGGQIVIRIAPPRLDGLVSALDGAGTVTRLSQDSQDVTDQLVDLDIRIRQIEASIGRLEELLDDAGALDDVFELERELTDRVIQLEQLRASQRNTENLVALATLTVQIEYRSPDVLEEIETGDDGIGDAFADGWNAFVGVLFAIGYGLAVSAPFLLTVLVMGLIMWAAFRRVLRRPKRATTPPPPIASQRATDDPVGPDLSEITDDGTSPTA